ncbi:MAG: DUF2088 domain-containing protein [Eubacterium sp.]|nr:DUF2088 domain-containing protein [Eubacterium sp.]
MGYVEFPKMNVMIQGMENVKLPKMMKVRQTFDDAYIEDIPAHVRKELDKIANKEKFSGKRLAVTVGSRGIPHITEIIGTTIEVLKEWGVDPFIVPAMGSHGGATAEGQREFIAGYGITEESMGVPILSSMDTVELGYLPDGTPVYCDKYAAESDGIVIINKVKPHTSFRGRHESGLAKMMAIGLGKHKGASMFHAMGFKTFPERLPEVYNVFMKNNLIAFGMGIVQNAYDVISDIEACEAEDFMEVDARLLEVAKSKIAKFHFHDVDVLVIDQIGKDISGGGYDPNVVGRSIDPAFSDVLNLQRLFIRGLSEGAHHNGMGIGRAEFTTRRCLNSVDWEATWVNCMTATELEVGKMPVYFENDRESLLAAIRSCNMPSGKTYDDAKIVRIKDTLHLVEFEVSENYREIVEADPRIEIISEPYEIEFDEEGFMI